MIHLMEKSPLTLILIYNFYSACKLCNPLSDNSDDGSLCEIIIFLKELTYFTDYILFFSDSQKYSINFTHEPFPSIVLLLLFFCWFFFWGGGGGACVSLNSYEIANK